MVNDETIQEDALMWSEDGSVNESSSESGLVHNENVLGRVDCSSSETEHGEIEMQSRRSIRKRTISPKENPVCTHNTCCRHMKTDETQENRIIEALKEQTKILRETHESANSRINLEETLKIERMEMEKQIRSELEAKIKEEWNIKNEVRAEAEEREMARIQHIENLESNMREVLEKTTDIHRKIVEERGLIEERKKDIEEQFDEMQSMYSRTKNERLFIRQMLRDLDAKL